MHCLTQLVCFGLYNHYFSAGICYLMHVFVPPFGGKQQLHKNGAHCCFLHNFNRTQKTLKPLFFCSNLAFAVKQQKPDYRTKSKTRIAHIGVFGVKKWFCFKSYLVMFKKHYISAGLGGFLLLQQSLALLTLSFLIWPSLSMVFLVFAFIYFFLMLFRE